MDIQVSYQFICGRLLLAAHGLSLTMDAILSQLSLIAGHDMTWHGITLHGFILAYWALFALRWVHAGLTTCTYDCHQARESAGERTRAKKDFCQHSPQHLIRIRCFGNMIHMAGRYLSSSQGSHVRPPWFIDTCNASYLYTLSQPFHDFPMHVIKDPTTVICVAQQINFLFCSILCKIVSSATRRKQDQWMSNMGIYKTFWIFNATR